MFVNIRTIKVKVSETVLEHIKEKLLKSKKYFPRIEKIEVFLTKQKYLCVAEIIINVIGQTIRISQSSTDFRSAFDLAADKVEQQLRKQKEKLKKHRKSTNLLFEDNYEQQEKMPLDLDISKFIPKILSIEEAIEEMDENEYMFWIFINRATKKLSVIYKKINLKYGLYEIDKRSNAVK
ncbi:MAG: ribosome-associated translation inhibitor RaiA [Elusimicrobia bacterium]|nr:ribosome-associated translation inhibitor RaiA [Elusimicrobiota bacterium]